MNSTQDEVLISELRARIKTQQEEIDQLRYEATHDGLTALLNRAGMQDWFRDRIRHDGDTMTTLCVLDLDSFKAYNDTYSHAAGDELLTRVALTIRGIARMHGGVAVRLGGDEFAVLVPGYDVECPAELVESAGFPVSMGVTRGDAMSWASMMRNADVALYHSKLVSGPAFTDWVPGQVMPDATTTPRRAQRG
jgi:GGDEF domain-containing protein